MRLCNYAQIEPAIHSSERMAGSILRIITQPYSEVYWGVLSPFSFRNSLTKHNKLTSFSYSVMIFSSRCPKYRLVLMVTLPISHVCLSPVVMSHIHKHLEKKFQREHIWYIVERCMGSGSGALFCKMV